MDRISERGKAEGAARWTRSAQRAGARGPHDDPGAVGRRVQRLRTKRGLTQRQLAEPAYTPAYISTLEAGRVRPSEAAVRHLADRLGVSYEELATGRPAHLATELRLRLVEAQRTLATGAAEDAATAYSRPAHRGRPARAPGRTRRGDARSGPLRTGDGRSARGPRALRGRGEAAGRRPAPPARPGRPGQSRRPPPGGRTPLRLLSVGERDRRAQHLGPPGPRRAVASLHGRDRPVHGHGRPCPRRPGGRAGTGPGTTGIRSGAGRRTAPERRPYAHSGGPHRGGGRLTGQGGRDLPAVADPYRARALPLDAGLCTRAGR